MQPISPGCSRIRLTLDDWMSLVFGFARRALTERPQLLEKMGLLARS